MVQILPAQIYLEMKLENRPTHSDKINLYLTLVTISFLQKIRDFLGANSGKSPVSDAKVVRLLI